MGDAALGRSSLRQLSAPDIKRCSALDFAGRFVGRAQYRGAQVYIIGGSCTHYRGFRYPS
jgi:hypothetical protein